MWRATLASLAAALIASCGNANWSSVHRTYTPYENDEAQGVLIDAQQRAILAVPMPADGIDGDSNGGSEKAQRSVLVCAEPSPDIASAISSSLSASVSGSIFSKGEAEAALSSALQQAVSQIGSRNATITLLRDGLFRQCEAYLNGLIDTREYREISNRYVDAMVTLLAIEQITASTRTDQTTSQPGGTGPSSETQTSLGSNTQQENQKTTVGNEPPGQSPGTPSDTAANTEPEPETASDAPQAPSSGDDGADDGGSARAESSAGAPVVATQAVGPPAPPVPTYIAEAVTALVSQFLLKSARDNCLLDISFIADDTDQLGELTPGQKAYFELCQPIIEASTGAFGAYVKIREAEMLREP